jgi:hypothetical protein
MKGLSSSLRSARLLIWVLLPALFILLAEPIINVRWQAYAVPLVVALLGLLLFHDVLRSDTNRPLGRDDVFKLISMSGAAIVAIALTGTFFETTRREQEKPYQQALLDQCVNVSKELARFASANPWDIKRESYEAFWQLFFGPLVIVEGKEVFDAMLKLGTLINNHRSDTGDQPQKCWTQADVDEFHSSPLEIEKGCRKQIRNIDVAPTDFSPGQLLKEKVENFTYLDSKTKVRQPTLSVSGSC